MRSQLGRSLLHCAVLAGDEQQVHALADHSQISQRDVVGMTALDLARRMIHRFEAGSAMREKLTAIIDFLDEKEREYGRTPEAQATTQAAVLPQASLLRSASDPDTAASSSAAKPFDSLGFLLALRKAASDGNTHMRAAGAKVQTADAKLLRGTQRFTPLTILRLTSDTDGEVQTPIGPQLQQEAEAALTTESKEADGSAAAAEPLVLSPEEELAALKQYIILDNSNAPSAEIATYSTEGTCEICYHKPIVAGESPKVCGHCNVPICVDCLFSFIHTTVEAALYAVPMIRCPGCLARLRTSVWTKALREHYQPGAPAQEGEAKPDNLVETLIQKYTNNASHLLTCRCASCDQTTTLFTEYPAVGEQARTANLDAILREFRGHHELQLLRLWKAFDNAEITALAFVTEMMEMFIAAAHEDHVLEDYERNNLEEYKIFQESWQVDQLRNNFQSLLTDVERRAGFTLAFLCQYPKHRTPCCEGEACFMCKVADFHHGRTCAEVQAAETGDAEYCPGCGVATLRTEGCRHIVCVCGTEWEWQGGDDYASPTY